MGFPAISSGVCWYERHFDITVEVTQVDIRQDWANDRTLRCPAERALPGPIFQISSFEQSAYELEKPAIMDMFCERFKHNVMRQTVEARGNIAFQEPRRSCPGFIDFL